MPSPSPLDTDFSGGLAVASKPTLLVCDDEEGPRQSLRIVFKNDYDVLVASNGPEAIALAKQSRINVAVLDILMQGMSGVELLGELKTLDPAIEVVMLTAYETIDTARQALRLGASDYLNKPFDIPTMRAAVTRAMEKHRASLAFHNTHKELDVLQGELTDHREREEIARTQGEIYASVLHDINSPLTVISGFVELLNRSMNSAAKVEGEQLETIKMDLHRLNDQVSRCFEISRRYLSFLNTERAEPVNVGVRQIFADLRDLLARHPSAIGNQLIIHDLKPDAVAEINGTDFLQILLNLTINALQAGDHSHRVELTATRIDSAKAVERFSDGPGERIILRENLTQVRNLLAVSVSDDAGGIRNETLEKMFRDRFTTKANGTGTGLGLSIVRRLAAAAKAAVHVKTVLGSGTTFTVFLPINS